MNWELFIGRFHPLMVHLPIGIFILAYLFELLWQFGFRELISSRRIIIATYVVGLLAGLMAAVSGWLLASSNDYGIEALNDHKWLGISTLLAMSLLIVYQVKASEEKAKLKLAAATLAIILVALTGHFGGNLTHGPTYLSEYGPSLLNGGNMKNSNLHTLHPDSVRIYAHLIQPIMEAKCVACHNKENSYGGLMLDSYAQLFREADHELPVQPGSPDNSDLLQRVSLPADHKKVMPPRGAQLSYTEIQVLRYWIAAGADSLASFKTENMSAELITLLQRDYGLDYSAKPYYEKVKADSLPEELLADLQSVGFRVRYLGERNLLLDMAYQADSIGQSQLEVLDKVAEQVTFLKMTNCQLSNALLARITEMPHLTRLDLSKNSLSEALVPFLVKHQHLEAVNLNETALDKEALQSLLAQLPLSRVYVWQTQVSADAIKSLSQNYPATEIVSQFTFAEVPAFKSVFDQKETQ